MTAKYDSTLRRGLSSESRLMPMRAMLRKPSGSAGMVGNVAEVRMEAADAERERLLLAPRDQERHDCR